MGSVAVGVLYDQSTAVVVLLSWIQYLEGVIITDDRSVKYRIERSFVSLTLSIGKQIKQTSFIVL